MHYEGGEIRGVTAFELAKRYLHIEELEGGQDHPLIQWWLMLAGFGADAADEIPWCAAFVNGIAWELDLPHPPKAGRPARARSWLLIGRPILPEHAAVGFDIAILKRGIGPQPGPEVIAAPGHVGFYAGRGAGLTPGEPERIMVLGGNQSDCVSVASYPAALLLGVRRLVWA